MMSSQRGFTLMEVLIAITITSVIGLSIWQVVSSVLNARERVDEMAGEFEQLQSAFLILERDITQAVNRPYRDVYGDSQPALTTRQESFGLMLVHQGWRNPLGLKRSELQRSGWEFTGENLVRRHWRSVDQGQDEDQDGIERTMLKNVISFDVRFMTQDLNWVDDWPEASALASGGTGDSGESSEGGRLSDMPRAVEITLEHRRYGELRRLFEFPDYSYMAAQKNISETNQQLEEEAGKAGDNKDLTLEEAEKKAQDNPAMQQQLQELRDALGI